MRAASEANLIVFRDSKRRVLTRTLLQQLADAITGGIRYRANSLDALIRAGELECGLSDASSPAAEMAARLTDQLSAQLVTANPSPASDIQKTVFQLASINLPESLLLSPPEGFAYYALHPLDFANLPLHAQSSVIIGIRSIGTVLSSVVAAAWKARGHSASRFTVRPSGHPYNRCTEFYPEQIESIREHAASSSQFLVVDEGPGLSGSSFLSVAEALTLAGIPADRITLIGTREPDPDKLYAENGGVRWGRFRFHNIQPCFYSRLSQGRPLGGGGWREIFLKSEREWPPCWPQMERVKFFSPDGNNVLKFDGLGRFGHEVRKRADCVFRSGFGPRVEDAGDGLSAHTMIPGRPLNSFDISASLIARMGHYCAFRANEMRTDETPQSGLEEMVRHNLDELKLPCNINLDLLHTGYAAITDAHMQPEEWILSAHGEVLKVDASTHGDDHFFPGPVDIAWDLAGAIVEWGLTKEARESLVATFQGLRGESIPRQRLSAFVSAYAVFRLAYSKMASLALQGSQEECRWQTAYEFYLQRLLIELKVTQWQPNESSLRV